MTFWQYNSLYGSEKTIGFLLGDFHSQEVVENMFHKLEGSTVIDRHFVEVLDAVSKTKDLAVITGRTGGLVWAQVVLRVKPKSVKTEDACGQVLA